MEKISIILLGISLALLIVYGADTFVASSQKNLELNSHMGKGFLPINEATRGGLFGGGAVIMSIVAFFISKKEKSVPVAYLLLINGGLIIVGMVAVLFATGLASSTNSSEMFRTVGFTIAMGAILLGLGICKIISNKKDRSIRQTNS